MEAREVDFLKPLGTRALLQVSACCAALGIAGHQVATRLLHRVEAQAVIRVARLELLGPVVPLSELKARAESFGTTAEALALAGVSEPGREARKYRFEATVDAQRDGSVLSLDVRGPDASRVLALTQDRVDRLLALTASSQAKAEPEPADVASASALFRRQNDAIEDAERRHVHLPALSTASEVIDAPHLVGAENAAQFGAGAGAFLGLLFGLGFATRPRSTA